MIQQPLHYLLLHKKDWMREDALKKCQLQKLKKIVKHAYETVPFYAELYASAGVCPNDIATLDDINKLPIINKEMVQAAGKKLLSRAHKDKKLVEDKTSGTSGKALTSYKTQAHKDMLRASKLRTYFANGYSLFHSTVFWRWTNPPKKYFHKIGLHREYVILRDTPIDEQIKYLRKINPDVLYVNPSRLTLVAQELKKRNIHDVRPRLIFADSETLLPHVRQLSVEQFGVDPVNNYGTMEFGFIAWECGKREGMHVNADILMLQILDPDTGTIAAEGTSGHIVVTDFSNYAFPLLRYDTEDVGVSTERKCSCGRVFPLLKEVQGRAVEFMTLPSGKKISANVFFTLLIRPLLESGQFHVVHNKKADALIVQIKADEGIKIDDENIKNKVSEKCEGMNVRIEKVSSFPKSTSYKQAVFSCVE